MKNCSGLLQIVQLNVNNLKLNWRIFEEYRLEFSFY